MIICRVPVLENAAGGGREVPACGDGAQTLACCEGGRRCLARVQRHALGRTRSHGLSTPTGVSLLSLRLPLTTLHLCHLLIVEPHCRRMRVSAHGTSRTHSEQIFHNTWITDCLYKNFKTHIPTHVLFFLP